MPSLIVILAFGFNTVRNHSVEVDTQTHEVRLEQYVLVESLQHVLQVLPHAGTVLIGERRLDFHHERKPALLKIGLCRLDSLQHS